MAERIYLLNDNSDLVPLEEAQYDSEKLLQELLANHPDLLAGEQINSVEPRRWLLIRREMSVPSEEDGNARWSLDHLFLDQDAVPTLVEVKRSSDDRIRRSVIGQMLDYAANAVTYWSVDEIRSRFESRCENDDQEPEEVLANFLGEDADLNNFWLQVKTNLQAGRIRLVFIADSIPSELRRIVEFLNQQMDPAEVLAIEIKQFVGKGIKSLVPKVFGQSEIVRQKKEAVHSSRKQWDEPTFLAALEEAKGEDARRVVEDILTWLKPQVTSINWGAGAKEGGLIPEIHRGKTKYQLCRIVSVGRFVFLFGKLSKKPPFDDELKRSELLTLINQIPGVHFENETLTKKARIPIEMLMTQQATKAIKTCLTWIIDQIEK